MRKPLGRVGGAVARAAIALAAALPSTSDALAQRTVFYEPPAVIARANYSPAGGPSVSELTIEGTPLEEAIAPRYAAASAPGANSTGLVALGEKAFSLSAVASGRSSSDASAFAVWSIEDPQDREEVKLVLEFTAVAVAAAPGAAFWSLELGSVDLLPAYVGYDEGGRIASYAPPRLEQPVPYNVLGHVRSLPNGTQQSDLTIVRHGQVVLSAASPGNTSEYAESLVLPASGNGELMVVIKGTANGIITGSAATMVDPVLRPHPDNPDVVVRMQAAEDPDPAPPFGGLALEDIAALGIDPQPFVDHGFFPPPPSEEPCTDGVLVAKPRLVLRTRESAERSRLDLRGRIELPPDGFDPPLDPMAHGVRVRIEDASGEMVFDETVPGGALDPATATGWSHDEGRRLWVYSQPGSFGIRRLVLRRVGAAGDVLRFTVKAQLDPIAVPDPGRLPLRGTIALDTPVARDGRCGEALFGGAPPATPCPRHDGVALVCR